MAPQQARLAIATCYRCYRRTLALAPATVELCQHCFLAEYGGNGGIIQQMMLVLVEPLEMQAMRNDDGSMRATTSDAGSVYHLLNYFWDTHNQDDF